MRRLIPAIMLLVGVAMGAQAGSAQVIERSGNTFHKATCPGPAAPGHARCHAHVVTDRAGNILANLNRIGQPLRHGGGGGGGTPAGYGPNDLRSAYNVAAAAASNGSGVTIAIVDAYGYPNAASDLATYRSTFGLPVCGTGCFTKVNQNGVQGSYPGSNTGWDQEQALDLDMVSAICPLCHILLVEANSNSFSDLAAAENTAASFSPHAISNSYGGSEAGSSDGAYTHAGIAITVSTGDSGYGVQFPASSPHVTAVGGTSLMRASNSRGWSERAWSGGGSGCSTVYAKPVWQSDPLCSKRMEADTSAVADPNTGVAVYGPIFGNFVGWEVFGGTSVAAPLTAGIYGLNGGAVTYGSNPYPPAPYGSDLFPYTTPANPALNYVTSGSNGNCGNPTTYFCTAGTGYDGPTGLGTPNGVGAF